jgi:spoIIIJ-associated protein
MDENFEKVKEEANRFFTSLGAEGIVEVSYKGDSTYFINFKTEDPDVLIGEKGEILLEIQYLLKLILKRKIKEKFYIDLDINDYKKKKITYLKSLAREIADEVALTKKEKILPPMSAYERRIIHLELAQRTDVTTQSIGEEPERRVVIKPYP